MATIARDPLLATARILILIVQAIMVIAAAALLIGAPLLVYGSDTIAAQIRAQYADPSIVFPLIPVLAIMGIALAMVVLAFLFLRKILRIVETVSDGDPFVPVNADRLTAMAWLMLGIQILKVPAGALAVYVATSMREPVAQVDIDIDLSGIVMVIVLFVLARVFREGARMREDLEGTV